MHSTTIIWTSKSRGFWVYLTENRIVQEIMNVLTTALAIKRNVCTITLLTIS